MFKKLFSSNTYTFFNAISENKGIEIQLTFQRNFAQWFRLELESHTKCDHERIQFTFELLKTFYFSISIYDFRHWNYERDTYETEENIFV